MPKPNRTETQRLLGVLRIKITELQNEINQMEAKKVCPFWHEFSTDTSLNACLYINSNHKCENLEICPGDSDAWCYKQIETGVKEKKGSEVMSALKVVLDKYADLRCDCCDMCEH